MSFIVNSETNNAESVALQPKVVITSSPSHPKIVPRKRSDVECTIVPKRHIEVNSTNYTLSECRSDIVLLTEGVYSLEKAEIKRRHSSKFCCIYTCLFIVLLLILALAVFVFVTKYV